MKLIKTIVVGILLVGLMSVVLEQKFNSPLEVINQEVVKEVTPDWASDEDAVKAAQDVIRRKELEAELNTVQSEIEALRARETALEKELGTY